MRSLDDCVPYLLNRAGARIARSFSLDLRPFGITLPMWRVLAALWERDGATMGALSETTAIEVSTLTRVVDAMERLGLARRVRPAGDTRFVTLTRTPAGRRLTVRIVPLAERYERVALDGLDAVEAETLRGLLRRVHANMDALDRSR